MREELALAVESDFARCLRQGLRGADSVLPIYVDSVAAARSERMFLGPWLEAWPQGLPPFGRIFEGRPATFDSDHSGPLCVIGHGAAPLGEPIHSLFSEGNAPYTIGVGTQEKDLDESMLVFAAAGYDALCCPVGDLDVSAVQYLTEAGRELRLSPIWMIESEACMRLVLDTDAPYFGFVAGDSTAAFPFAAVNCWHMRRQLPAEARALCFYGAPLQDTESFMVRLAQAQFHAYLDLNP